MAARAFVLAALLAAGGNAWAQFMKCAPMNEAEKTQAEFCSAHVSCRIAVELLKSCNEINLFIARFFSESKAKPQDTEHPYTPPERPAFEPSNETPQERQRRRQATVDRYLREDGELASEMRNLNCSEPRSIDAQRCVDIGMRALELQRNVASHDSSARSVGGPPTYPVVGALQTTGMVRQDGGNFVVYPPPAGAPMRRAGSATELTGALEKAARDAPQAKEEEEAREAQRRATSARLVQEDEERQRREREEAQAQARAREAERARKAEAERRQLADAAAVLGTGAGGGDAGGKTCHDVFWAAAKVLQDDVNAANLGTEGYSARVRGHLVSVQVWRHNLMKAHPPCASDAAMMRQSAGALEDALRTCRGLPGAQCDGTAPFINASAAQLGQAMRTALGATRSAGPGTAGSGGSAACSAAYDRLNQQIKDGQARMPRNTTPVPTMQFALWGVTEMLKLGQGTCKGQPQEAELLGVSRQHDDLLRACRAVASGDGHCVPRIPW